MSPRSNLHLAIYSLALLHVNIRDEREFGRVVVMARGTLMKAVLSLAVSSAFFLGAVPAAQARQLNQEAIRALFPGTFDVSYKHKTNFVVTARANGSLSGRLAGITDQGTWSVRGQKLCIAFSMWHEGRTKCKDVFLEGDWIRSGKFFFRKR
jgi:hypothetical protein